MAHLAVHHLNGHAERAKFMKAGVCYCWIKPVERARLVISHRCKSPSWWQHWWGWPWPTITMKIISTSQNYCKVAWRRRPHHHVDEVMTLSFVEKVLIKTDLNKLEEDYILSPSYVKKIFFWYLQPTNSKIIFGGNAFWVGGAVSISTIFRADGDRTSNFLSGLTLFFQYRFNPMKY